MPVSGGHFVKSLLQLSWSLAMAFDVNNPSANSRFRMALSKLQDSLVWNYAMSMFARPFGTKSIHAMAFCRSQWSVHSNSSKVKHKISIFVFPPNDVLMQVSTLGNDRKSFRHLRPRKTRRRRQKSLLKLFFSVLEFEWRNVAPLLPWMGLITLNDWECFPPTLDTYDGVFVLQIIHVSQIYS